MKILLVLSSIAVPTIMIILSQKSKLFQVSFDLLAILSALIFGNISATSIHEILIDDTVFMTNIHGIFLNPFFLATGAYLGVYTLYLLILRVKAAFLDDNTL
ncbi:transposase [Evansella tamaricis]|uniref:Transposase n=1 Tax=Evansella tamaricis TaxID=2069301 RepID=A0ABS6JHW4_9BACI|nr:transposase [Evansella tamaricis]MBU9713186.1 transposase [Evansella tamaricis]